LNLPLRKRGQGLRTRYSAGVILNAVKSLP
jgi:hypothetical protein